jgi:pyruvate kinase
MTSDVIAVLKESGLLQNGDQVILTYGDRMETVGATNACKIVTIV